MTNNPLPADQRFKKLWHFHGGLRLPLNKEMSTSLPLRTAKLPSLLTVPLSQHIGTPAEPVVTPGESVLKGQLIAKARDYVSASVHAPSSGTIVAIEKRPVPHPSGMDDECVVIETDGMEKWRWRQDRIDDYTKLDPSELRNRLREAGIVGLGGAGFPTYVKMNPGPARTIDLLILNGAECEPYISCDEMLMQTSPWEIVIGLQILRHAVHAKECVIALEDNSPKVLAAMEVAVASLNDPTIHLVTIPTIYPTGGEKQLIKVLTGMEVPSQGLPPDIGVVCQNVGTATAICKAVTEREPLISRIVTVTGAGIRQPQNIVTLIGTPMAQLIEECGGYTEGAYRLLMGGPLMGIPLASDALPVTKTTNCLLVATQQELPPPQPSLPCIRCGECAQVCPADLLPQQLYWHILTKDFDKARGYDLFDCIECGCCAQVCPSHLPLVQYYRHGKAEIWAAERAKEQADRSAGRYEFRTQRLEQQKRDRAEQSRLKREALQNRQPATGESSKSQIQAALDRVRTKQREHAAKTPATHSEPDSQTSPTENKPGDGGTIDD